MRAPERCFPGGSDPIRRSAFGMGSAEAGEPESAVRDPLDSSPERRATASRSRRRRRFPLAADTEETAEAPGGGAVTPGRSASRPGSTKAGSEAAADADAVGSGQEEAGPVAPQRPAVEPDVTDMSAVCVRWLLSHAARTASSIGPPLWSPASRPTTLSRRFCVFAGSWSRPFSTEVSDAEKTPPAKKKKNTPAHASISSVGRKIPHREIQVISEAGENLGTMHRADVIKIMDQKSLKLVLLSENREPPVYQLMSGKQIHEEQLRQREKSKTKAPPPQMKELTFSVGIASHDLSTKLKQVESWLEKKHHVRMTVRGGHAEPAVSLDVALEQMVEQMDVMVAFVSKPKVIKDGRAAMCILRPPSAKELSQKGKSKTEEKKPPSTTSEAFSSTTEESTKL